MDGPQAAPLSTEPTGRPIEYLGLALPKQGSDCRKPPKASSKLLQPMSGTSRAVSRTPRIMNMATMKMSQIKKFLPSFIADSFSFGFGVVIR